MNTSFSIVIPTYKRERVLLDTIQYLLELDDKANEIIIIDQTLDHKNATETALKNYKDAGNIRWMRLQTPSIPAAMNQGILAAQGDILLFLDDDIRPEPDLITAHRQAHHQTGATIVAGRVIQPWQESKDFSQETSFHFATLKPRWINEFMGGNFSINRDAALQIGGFDQNFVKVAYRFEAEFAHRILKSGGKIHFSPTACIHHLKVIEGGTRTYGEHLTTWKPDHAVGAYYYSLRTHAVKEFFFRALRAVATRHHLRNPWWIPVTLFAELRGMLWALFLFSQGPRYINATMHPHQELNQPNADY